LTLTKNLTPTVQLRFEHNGRPTDADSNSSLTGTR